MPRLDAPRWLALRVAAPPPRLPIAARFEPPPAEPIELERFCVVAFGAALGAALGAAAAVRFDAAPLPALDALPDFATLPPLDVPAVPGLLPRAPVLPRPAAVLPLPVAVAPVLPRPPALPSVSLL
jgi:hypothetical protein